MRVLQFSRQAGLCKKALFQHPRRLLGKIVVEQENLDGDFAACEGIAAEVNAAGRTLADFLDYLVLPDVLFKLEFHVDVISAAAG